MRSASSVLTQYSVTRGQLEPPVHNSLDGGCTGSTEFGSCKDVSVLLGSSQTEISADTPGLKWKFETRLATVFLPRMDDDL